MHPFSLTSWSGRLNLWYGYCLLVDGINVVTPRLLFDGFKLYEKNLQSLRCGEDAVLSRFYHLFSTVSSWELRGLKFQFDNNFDCCSLKSECISFKLSMTMHMSTALIIVEGGGGVLGKSHCSSFLVSWLLRLLDDCICVPLSLWSRDDETYEGYY